MELRIRRLNLWGHDGNKLSNCCPTLSEMNNSKESVVNKKSDKSEHDNSMTKNENLNLSEENKEFIQKRMDLLFETLCQTFSLINAKKAKKRKYKEAKKVDRVVSFSYSAENQRMVNDASTELIDDLYEGKNQSTKICKISYLSNFKNIEENSDKKQNFSENIQQSYEGNDKEIKIPSHKDFNNKHVRDAFSNEIYSEHENKYCKIRKIDPKNNCNVPPLVNSTTKILSRFSAESKQDKIIQANVLHFPLKNKLYNVSSPKTKSNEKFENVFDGNNKVNIEIQKKHAVQKNLKGTTKNYPVDKEFNEKVNLNITNIGKADIVLVDDSDPEIEILEECTVERNLNETTKKYPDDISTLISKKNSHRSNYNKCVEDADAIGTNEYNIPPTIIKDVSNSNILQMEILNKQTKSCSHSADYSISFAKIDKIPNRSTVSEFTVSGEQVLNQEIKEIIPLIKPCYVAVYKLPIDKSMEFIDPIVMNSFCHENASYSVVKHGSKSCIFEAKKVRHSNPTITSPKVNENVNIDDDDVSAINETINVDEIPNVDNVSAIKETIKVDEIPNVETEEDISAVNETTKVSYKKKHLTILPCSVYLEDIRKRYGCKKCEKRRRKLLSKRQKKERKRWLLERYEYVRQWLLKIEECEDWNCELMENMDENFCRNSNEVSVSQENRQICHTSSDILPKYPLDNFEIVDCSVSLERINLNEYLIKNKNAFHHHDLKNPSENLVGSEPNVINIYEIDENFVSDSSFNKLEVESSTSVENISEISVIKPKKMVDNCTTEKPLKNNETADNHSNIICHSDYKCVQCRMPISSDDELYHHLCCGKRKKVVSKDFSPVSKKVPSNLVLSNGAVLLEVIAPELLQSLPNTSKMSSL
ncbi:hypothetical protein HNY73_022327 [Argiope bruennichi]|uniref:Uncharacterized protein n=1 Tax=Argiope bruennichi TaxID=94029 RepID=A0A8T0E451_ARGBR|nr:hypothetical protein HNY73_022327 [Argiope bruennichi]